MGIHPAVGAVLSVVGVALFVVGIVDATADAPSGPLSAAGGDTPWLVFAGVACSILGGILFTVSVGRGRRSPAPTTQELSGFLSMGSPRAPGAQPVDAVDRLEKLVRLRDAGALTAAEFEAQKASILREA